MIKRPIYMDKLNARRGHGLVKVVTGVRRCGKTTLLALFREQLMHEGVPEASIIHVDYERVSNMHMKNRDAFISHVLGRLERAQATAENPAYLFIDEVQELEDWAEVINGIRSEFNIDIYVTGSNSRALSGENLTYLSGRYVALEMYPLSLAEWCVFTQRGINGPQDVEQAYSTWVTQGGFPAVALAASEELRRAVLDGIFESVFTRDIILRGKIKNEAAFLRVASFALDNVGNQTSAGAISKALGKAGHRVAPETVDGYLNLMCSAHMLYRCDRFDLRGKERLKTNAKYYAVDSGLRRRVLGPGMDARSQTTENAVYIELLRRGYEVCVGTLPNAEIDFVAEKDGHRLYIQASETVLDPDTRAREFRPFRRLDDAWPCILVTKDREDYSADGVRHVNLYDLMLGGQLPE